MRMVEVSVEAIDSPLVSTIGPSISHHHWIPLESGRVACAISSMARVQDAVALGSIRAGGSVVLVGWTRRSGVFAKIVGGGVQGVGDLLAGEGRRGLLEEARTTCWFTLLLDRVFLGRVDLTGSAAELRRGQCACALGAFNLEP